MPSERNKGRATQMLASLEGEYRLDVWIKLIIPIIGFLLARYIDGE